MGRGEEYARRCAVLRGFQKWKRREKVTRPSCARLRPAVPTRAFLIDRLLRYAQLGIEFGRFVEDSIFNYQDCFSDVADIFGRIAIHQNHIR
jgi:hypothetical protein